MAQSRLLPVKFAADRMLGKLTKWLRVIGQDVSYGRHLSGHGLVRAARQENRIILTRDRGLRRIHTPELVFIASNDFREQLRQVVQEFRLSWRSDLLKRCLACNRLLQPRSKASVHDIVPEYVFSTQEIFSSCDGCGRIYWPATHHQKMLQELEQLGLN